MELDMLQERTQAASRVIQKFIDNEIDRCEYDFQMYKLNSYSDSELIEFHVVDQINN